MSAFRHPLPVVSTPARTVEAVLYQDSKGGSVDDNLVSRPNLPPAYPGVTVAFKLDQAVTFIHKWGPSPTTADADLVIINGTSATGETAAANAFFSRLCWLQPGRNRISILAGGTAPTAASVAVELYSGPVPFVGIV